MSKEFKAGLFVVVIVIAGFASYFWASKFSFQRRTYTIKFIFPDITGLKKGDPIRVYGVNKGHVTDIKFTRKGVLVTGRISRDVIVYTDAIASIEDVAMISGTKFVRLDPGKSGIPMPEDSLIHGKPSLGIAVSIFGEVGQKLSLLLGVLERENVMDEIAEAAADIGKAAKTISTSVEDYKGKVGEAINQLELASITLSEFASRADTIAKNINLGKGTMGRLINDTTLYNELVNTLRAVRSLVEDIKENPQKYTKGLLKGMF